MFKIISLTLPLLILVSCHQLPKTDTAIKYYDTETKEVKMVAKYQSGPIPRLFYENTCIDGDAVRLMRKHSNKSVEDLYNLGSNCVEISLSENGIK